MIHMIIPVLSLMGTFGVSGPSGDDAEAVNELLRTLEVSGFDIGPAKAAGPFVSLFRVVHAKQDHAQPAKDLCCHTLTPIRIGQKTFEKGIGAHANGEIVLELLKPAKRFRAYVGIDNNDDTQGTRGSAQFVVHLDGVERFKSPICRGGQEAVKVEVDLTGASKLELVVTDAGDGFEYDQADWAEASLEGVDGKQEYIGDAFAGHYLESVPTGFTFNGQSCWKLFEAWQKQPSPPAAFAGGTRYVMTWAEPGSGFRATLDVTVYEQGAAEFQWRFENTGGSPSGRIAEARSLDLRFSSPPGMTILHSCSGGLTGDFEQRNERLGFELAQTPLGQKALTVTGGRSSNGDMPFYALTHGANGWNFMAALGWSGQWKAEARFDADRKETVFYAGIDPVNFRLPAGESVSMPSGLIIPFRGDLSTGTNQLRRLLRTHYQAKLGGQPVLPPVSFNSWFVFDNRVNDAMLRELANEAAPLGIEYFCLDAGWFDGDFPNGVGNWTVHKGKFPNGLRPVADHVHSLGMKFGLWFEPERVADGTRWQRDYPDLLLKRNLLDLGNPRARAIVLEMLDKTIAENGVDWIRYDFNSDPLEAWASVEGDDEKGLRQIRYINGAYEVLAELMRRRPNLLIEQCASGGRRIDLQTIRLGHTYWKSDDTNIQSLMRFHETGANAFLLGGHLNTNYCHYRSEGEMLALFAGPLGFGVDFRALTAQQKAAVKQVIAAYKQVRPWINQDYYPLFPQSKADQTWCGWQFIDPDMQEGFFAAYRQQTSPYNSATVTLSGLQNDARFTLRDLITGQESTRTGAELSAGYFVTLEKDCAIAVAFSRAP